MCLSLIILCSSPCLWTVVDGSILLTGSFNWTRTAAIANVENLLVTSEAPAVAAYTDEFEKLWSAFTQSTGLSKERAAVKIQGIYRGRQARRDKAAAATSALARGAGAPPPPARSAAPPTSVENSFGGQMDVLLSRLSPATPTLAIDDVKEVLRRVGARPSQAAALCGAALQRVAARLDTNRNRSLAYLKAGSAMVGAIEASLYQPPSLKDCA